MKTTLCIAAAAAVILTTPSSGAETGIASHYGYHDGQTTKVACRGMGPLRTETEFTAAHKTLPCGARVEVLNLRTQRRVVVTITDRGPFWKGRILDTTYRVAQELGFAERGIDEVRIAELRWVLAARWP